MTRAALPGTLRTGPGAPAWARALGPPYLGRRLVLSPRAEVLRCSGLRYCRGVQAPALPHLSPGALPAEGTRAQGNGGGAQKARTSLGGSVGISQGDGETYT